MTIEDLKKHCITTIKMSEAIESIPNVKITDNRSLQEHKMVLQLIEAWEGVKQDLYKFASNSFDAECAECYRISLHCVEEHLKEVENDSSSKSP